MKSAEVRCLAAEIESPPSRAAWIEIVDVVNPALLFVVAAFTGGVD